MNLKDYQAGDYQRGRSVLVEGIWLLVSALFISSWMPGSWHRRVLLKMFGARLGKNVVIKPRVRIKFPWKLVVGDYSWLGEDVWIDNLDKVTIGAHCCISQGTYLCTGSHRWDLKGFDLDTRAIQISDQCWVSAQSTIAPGTEMDQGSVLKLRSVAYGKLQAWSIYAGNPAIKISDRTIKN